MDATTTALLLVAALITSFVSGVLGMGGGMLLMGVLGWLLPVPQAMLLHGFTQMASNGLRAGLLRRAVRARVIAPYLLGAAVALALFSGVRWVPSRGVLLVALGALPWLSGRLPGGLHIDERRPATAAGCGLVVGLMHLLAGVSGPVLDVFFLRSPLDRRQVVATKAATQTLAHGFKLTYYGLVVGAQGSAGPATSAPLLLGLLLVTAVGTALGARALGRLSERWFRSAGAVVIRLAGTVYLVRGLTLLAMP